MQSPSHRQGNGTAQSSAQNGHAANILHLSGQTQGTHKVLEAVALVQLVQSHGRTADFLINYGNQTVHRAGDGQWDPLSLFIHPQDNELARLGLCGHQRCIHRNLADFRRQHLLLRNFILLHCFSSCQSSSFFHRCI